MKENKNRDGCGSGSEYGSGEEDGYGENTIILEN